MNIEFSELAIYWAFLHILFPLMYIKKTQWIVSLLIIFLTLPVFLSGKITGDIANSYIYGINGSAVYDIGFMGLVYLLSSVGLDGLHLIYVIQAFVFVLLLYCLCKFSYGSGVLVCLSILLLSVFPFLAINNVLRQGISALFIMLCYISLKERSFINFIGLSALSTLFHWSAPFFIFIILFYHFFSRKIILFILAKRRWLGQFGKFRVSRLLIFAISIVSVSVFFSFVFPDVMALVSRNSDRYSGILKVLSVGAVLFVSFLLVRKNINQRIVDVVLLRLLFFFLFSATSALGYPELSARILFFYFLLETIYVVQTISLGGKERLSGVFVVLSYGFAINVLELITNYQEF